MKIGIVLGGLALASIALVAATPRPIQDALAATPRPIQDADAGPAGGVDMAAMAERMMMATTPGEEHAGLARLVGKWNVEIKISIGPGMPMATMNATSEIETILGGRYSVEHITGSFMGQPFKGMSITGYDNLSGTFDNVWVDNQSTAMATMKGRGEAESVILWNGTRNDPMMGEVAVRSVQKMTATGMTYENFHTVDGQENKQMTLTYTRPDAAAESDSR
jgi:hypothetical protein